LGHIAVIILFLACYMFGDSSCNLNWWSVWLFISQTTMY